MSNILTKVSVSGNTLLYIVADLYVLICQLHTDKFYSVITGQVEYLKGH
jgi:hypothetical protein